MRGVGPPGVIDMHGTQLNWGKTLAAEGGSATLASANDGHVCLWGQGYQMSQLFKGESEIQILMCSLPVC